MALVTQLYLRVQPLLAEAMESNFGCDTVMLQDPGWFKPQVGWMKLNRDRALNLRTKEIGVGGLIRDCRSDWVVGFCRFVGLCSLLQAELWAILEGIQMA
ncbi:hypothetical protein GOBAR_DD29131 [Gossypium barbadense]|nr:hypothetical protein GOBAR_DD29131 [Gossypium barbadense]